VGRACRANLDGRVRGRIDFVRTERVTVYRERWNRRLTVNGQSPAGYTTVGTTAHRSAQVNWCGSDLSEHRIAYARTAKEIDFFASDREDHVVCMVRSEVLARYLGEAKETDALVGHHIHCHPERGRALIRTLKSIIARHASGPDLMQNLRDCEALESEVLGALAFSAEWDPGPGEDRTRRREALRRALAHAESRVEPIRVTQLAAAAGVSQRTLEYAFREELGMTPLQFLRRRRLTGAHRDLRSAAPGSTTVTKVAVNWGFRELGRFAVEHRRMFGVSPSEALAQTRSPIRRLHS
jgi:AraC family ethanolamine operon transcriptional activator